jgi:hypothetical protein
MTAPSHIKAFRLFDLSQAHSSERGFQLTEWEREHLESCEECREVAAVFARQTRERLPVLPGNGQVNTEDALYRNVCCGLELFIPAGKVFPDCQRHKNLPTVWKKSSDTPIPRAKDLDKKRSA